MKTFYYVRLTVVLVVFVSSCTKESIKSSPIATTQAIEQNAVAVLHIGDAYQGGIIFYLDSTKQHGLIAAKSDQSTAAEWSEAPVLQLTNATGKGLGAGQRNTKKIISVQGYNGYAYAAYLCSKYKNEGYTDWYLPSVNELSQLYKHRSVISDLGYSYWSSTEYIVEEALAVSFGNNGIVFNTSKHNANNVRAIRVF